jgi:hypothetical protein
VVKLDLGSANEPYAEGVSIEIPVVGPDACQDYTNQVEDRQCPQQEKTDGKKNQEDGDNGVDQDADLEIDGLLAVEIYEVGFLSLEKPYDQRPEDTPKGDHIAAKRYQVAECCNIL